MDDARARGRVVSDTRGRLRVRIDHVDRHPGVLTSAHDHLRKQSGVHHVELNHATGSVVVRYDPSQLSSNDILSLFREVGVVALQTAADLGLEVPGDTRSVTGRNIVSAVDSLDKRIAVITGRTMDLKLLFPLGLFAVGLRQLFTQGLGLNQVPAYVMLWYAFDSFWKFHAPKPENPAKPQTGRKVAGNSSAGNDSGEDVQTSEGNGNG